MIKKLLQKYQAYRDNKFLARLERVLNNNVVGANLFIEKNVFSLRGFHMYFPKGAVADLLNKFLQVLSKSVFVQDITRNERLRNQV